MMPGEVLVVSPHCDDAVFSCGDFLIAHPCATVVTVFAGRPPVGSALTPWDAASGFRPNDDVIAARRSEDRSALTLLGATPLWLEFRDAQYGPSPDAAEIGSTLAALIAKLRPRTLVLPLGLFHSDHDLAHRGRFFTDPEILRQVEVLRGGQSTLYGSGALGGVIFLETKDPADLLDEMDLRSEVAGGFASRVSIHPGVRKALFNRQRAFALQARGAVLDGRDIGTVIAPEADVKLFITASVEARAKRRYAEMVEAGFAFTLKEIFDDMRARDERDTTRAASPLAKDASYVEIDTSDLAVEEVVERMAAAVEGR